MTKNDFQKVKDEIKNKYKDMFELVNTEICQDNYVGEFTICNNDIKNMDLWFRKEKRCEKREYINLKKHLKNRKQQEKINQKQNKEEKTLLIVLESPHIDEYDKENYEIAPAPALGKTGQMLDNYFIENIKEKLTDGVYKVILSNAIQYQCSLGKDTDVFRDRIWLSMWFNEGHKYKNKFINRLKCYEPDIIVNLCTQGSHQSDLLRPEKTKTVINHEYLKSISEIDLDDTEEFKLNEITLHSLTQVAIKEYQRASKNITMLKGYHPSSWGRNKENLKIKEVQADE